MASRPILVTASTSLILAARNNVIDAFSLCAAAATSTLELFDGTIGSIATTALGVGGTGYAANDLFSLVQAGGGVVATGRVDTVGAGIVTAFTILTTGTGYVAGTTYATVHTSGSGNDGLTVTVSTITDAGTSIGKISATANLSELQEIEALTINGLSARISGASAKGYIYVE